VYVLFQINRNPEVLKYSALIRKPVTIGFYPFFKAAPSQVPDSFRLTDSNPILIREDYIMHTDNNPFMATPRVVTRREGEAWKSLMTDSTYKTEIEAQGEPPSTDTLLTALNKYIPATVIVGYTFLDSIFKALGDESTTVASTTGTPPYFFWWMFVFIVLFFGTGLLTYRITQGSTPASGRSNDQRINKIAEELRSTIYYQRLTQSAVAMIAFAGYVLALGGPFALIKACGDSETGLSCSINRLTHFAWAPYIGAVALVIATLVVAIIISKDILAE
jgi:hypothetical protein